MPYAGNRAVAGVIINSPSLTFADFDLPRDLVAALSRNGIETTFPIQQVTIADALAGHDVLGKARTGAGKTFAFGLPTLARLSELPKPGPRQVAAIILVPTRELAMQVNDALEPYAHSLQVSMRLVAGGLSMSKQIQSLARGVHLVVATPGRLLDLSRRNNVDLSKTEITIIDEADHLADMGFMPDVTAILDQIPSTGQRLLFSATLDGEVDVLVRKYMHDPVRHDVMDNSPRPQHRHVVFAIPPRDKYRLATRIASREGRTLVFVRTKLGAERVAEEMIEAGLQAVSLHGDKTQNERNQAIAGFRKNRYRVLVATDVAARGIHVDEVDLVLQVDPPADFKDYTHRSGRTARAGASGLAVMLALPHQRRSVERIMESAGVEAEFQSFRTLDEKALARIDALCGVDLTYLSLPKNPAELVHKVKELQQWESQLKQREAAVAEREVAVFGAVQAEPLVSATPTLGTPPAEFIASDAHSNAPERNAARTDRHSDGEDTSRRVRKPYSAGTDGQRKPRHKNSAGPARGSGSKYGTARPSQRRPSNNAPGSFRSGKGRAHTTGEGIDGGSKWQKADGEVNTYDKRKPKRSPASAKPDPKGVRKGRSGKPRAPKASKLNSPAAGRKVKAGSRSDTKGFRH